MSVTVVGIDLSLSSTGVARVTVDDRGGVWRTWQVASEPRGKGVAAQGLRISDAAARIIEAVLVDPLTDLAVIEAMPPGTIQKGIRDTAGLWWMVVSALARQRIPIATVMPSTLKVYATGYGGSTDRKVAKAEMVKAARAAYPGLLIAGCHDVADAAFLAAAGARHLGRPVDCLPDTNLRALEKFKWPESLRHNGNGD